MNYAYMVVRNSVTNVISDEERDEFMEGLYDKAGLDSKTGNLYKNVLVPIVEAMFCYLNRDFKRAYQIMQPICDQERTPELIGTPQFRHNSIGGSLVQRDVLDILWDILKNSAYT